MCEDRWIPRKLSVTESKGAIILHRSINEILKGKWKKTIPFVLKELRSVAGLSSNFIMPEKDTPLFDIIK